MATPVWDEKRPQNCAACGKSLKQVLLVYTVQGSKDGWCSVQCRSTKTKEDVPKSLSSIAKFPDAQPQAPAAVVGPPKPVRTAKEVNAALAKGKPAASKPTPEAKPARAPRSSNPFLDESKKLYRTDARIPNLTGNRKAIWECWKEGITIKAFYDACNKKGLADAKGNLFKLGMTYKIVEAR